MSTGSDGYTWSRWEWDGKRGKFYRFRWNSKNKKVWESQEPSTPRAPEPSTAASVATFSSSATESNPQYYEDYQYGGQLPASDPVAGLASEMASTTLSQPPEAIGYAGHDAVPSIPSSTYQVAKQYQPAQPATIPGSYRNPASYHERSMFSASDRMRNYTASSSTSRYSSAPTGYNVIPSGLGYNDAAFVDGEDDYADEDPYYDPSQRARGGPSQSSDFSRTYDSEGTVTQANSLPREPPPPLPTTMDLTRLPQRPRIKGTGGKAEPLNPEFKVMNSKHFKPGHIFKVVWTEPRGEPYSDAVSISGRTNATDVTIEDIAPRGAYQSPIHSGVRRFVIVATGVGFSNCVPILTYGRQGLFKSGITQEYHAIIHSSEQVPALSYTPNCQPIQFQGRNVRHKLDEYSLINYAKIYPVEHNVKVQFIGWIAQASQRPFVRDFNAVWQSLKQLPQ